MVPIKIHFLYLVVLWEFIFIVSCIVDIHFYTQCYIYLQRG